MWNNKKVSVILPSYNEEKSIYDAILDFKSIKYVDEVLVIDNNSIDKTHSEAKRADAKVIIETKQGYGHALQRGLREAEGEIIITAEPDGTFIGKDVLKLLHYSDEFDVIFGTRTSKSLIWSGAKMGWFLRLGNVFVAKLMEYIHNGPCLTDVGCTLKLINRNSLNNIIDKFRVGGSHFSVEFMTICIKSKLKCIEIPVNYLERKGESKITSNFWKSFKLGLVMIWFILKRKIY